VDLKKLPLFDLLTRRMTWLSQRQEVLAQNIANANTPDYTPQDLKPMPFAETMKRLAPVNPDRTSDLHLAGTVVRRAQPFRDEEQRKRYEVAPDGNSVVIEEQMIKVAETQMDYQLITNLYRKHVDMIKTAIGRT
jgi:flagellar basal-body rod protein FlgB